MNEASVQSPVPSAAPVPGNGWSRRKIYFLVLVAFLAHLAFIFILGTKKQLRPRAVGPIPQLQIAEPGNELIALNDPTLFVLPHVGDYSSAIWLKTPAPERPVFHWAEPAGFLPLPVAALGVAFNEFMRTNPVAGLPLELKPEPKFSEPDFSVEPALPQQSSLRIVGDLASRRRLNDITVPSLRVNDVIVASRVQVLVDPAGDVVSAVLLPSDEPLDAGSRLAAAEQTALQLARRLRFAPAPELMLGRIIFTWHTVATNAP